LEFKTSDGITLAYDDQGTGTPVLILTGIGGSRQIWQSQVKALLAAGYRVINVDARNQGASEHTAKGLRISRHAVDVHELITHLQLPKVILLGNSMGAATCFAYVSLFGDSQLKAIIDVDQSPKMINDATWPYGYQDLDWANFPTYLKLPMGKATKKRIADDLFATVKTVAKAHPYDADLNYPFLVDHAFQDWRDVIQTLKIPLLVVAGAKSPYFNSDFAKVTATMAPKGQAAVLAGCGHIVMAEMPAAFNQTLLTFLKTLAN
jgi:peroxiredoxin